MRPLTTDLAQAERRPYFFWDEDTSIEELRAGLERGTPEERLRLLAKMLREARDTDVWLFVKPQEVADALPRLAAHLGRRRSFWEYVIDRFRAHGFVR